MKNSVVMATYNGEKYIMKQLDSIKNQTLSPDEVIICDDCSTDKTVEIVQGYIKKNNLSNWILYKNDINQGFYNNFFNALKKSKGDIIYLSDQDDVWDINKIEKFTRQYDSNLDLMMIQSRFRFIDETGMETRQQEDYHYFKTGHICKLSVFDMCKYAGSGYTMSFRKCISDKIFRLHLDEKKDIFIFHDIILGLMAAAEGECLLNRDVIDSHRVHSDNVTKKRNESYVSGRTKEKQLDILKRRVAYFNIIATNTRDKEKKKIFLDFAEFSKYRKNYIDKFSVKRLIYLIKKRNMYASKVGVVTDSLYSLGFEKIICMIAS